MLKRLTLVLILITAISCGCDLIGGAKGKYNRAIGDMEKLIADLQALEKPVDDYMMERAKPEGSCSAVIKLDELKARTEKISSSLDAIKPKDMPMKKETQQSGTDPNTGQPMLESVEVIDLGKITGTEQNLWATLNSAELALTSATGTLSIACQCIDGGDKNSIHCSLTAAQMGETGRFSLGLESTVNIYIKPAREFLEKM